MEDNKTASTAAETTQIEQVDMDLDSLDFLGTPGAENVLLPEEQKPNVFTKPSVDLSFIDKDSDEPGSEAKEKVEIDDVINEVDPNADFRKKEEEKPEEKKAGRPKVEKNGMAEVVNKLIEAGKIVPFDDDKPLDEYTLNDYQELLEANFAEIENKVRQETPVEFFDSLPQELQYAAKYVADGGQDLKGLFKVLASAEEVRDLNPSHESDQEQIVREYLRATNFGTIEEINEEIDSWKDRGELEAKALKFKPKLDAMQERVVQGKLAEQENLRKHQQAAAQQYMENVYNTVAAAEINGLKLDKKTQGLLYNGLVQPNYPSISGRPTNLLGHLLEKYQYVEPNHGLIAEALWLLSDPEGYRGKVREQAKVETTEKVVRQLKTEQAKLQSSAPVIEKDEVKERRIPRNPGGGFFKR
ncbi:hypothetical protein EB118_07070 [bacterium]|nr:hypothetical protein [bacterium]NDD82923.1 hypothetical protein [bacterium]NDG29842.1 hypothetical protein [bacterium]